MRPSLSLPSREETENLQITGTIWADQPAFLSCGNSCREAQRLQDHPATVLQPESPSLFLFAVLCLQGSFFHSDLIVYQRQPAGRGLHFIFILFLAMDSRDAGHKPLGTWVKLVSPMSSQALYSQGHTHPSLQGWGVRPVVVPL